MEKRRATREDAMKIARYLGCRGAHQRPDGNWVPCSDEETLTRISNQAEEKSRKKKKKKDWENLREGGVIGIDTLPDGGLVSGKDAEFEEYELIELKAGSYTKPRLRESIKRRIMAGSRGGKPGQWSARKAQLVAIEYRRAGGGYRGGKKNPQRSLDKWTREEWTTSDGKPAIRNGRTTRYLPKGAWEKLTPAQREATNRKKRRASQQGRQFVANTERARQAGARIRNSQKDILVKRVVLYGGFDEFRHQIASMDVRTKGRRFIRSVNFDPNARDADGDGMVQDATRFQRPAKPRVPQALQPQLDLTPGQPSQPTERAKQKPRRVIMPDYFKKIGYQPGPPMVKTPQNTKRRFIYKGRRYDNERYAKVHQKISDAIIGAVTKKRAKGQQKTMWVLGGMPGSYKSSMRREGFMGIPDRDAAAHIDPDEVKEMIPEYLPWVAQGETGAADYVHKESRDIANNVLQRAADEDLDIVYDTSGLFNRGYRTLSEARSMGYKVVAHYTTGDFAKLLEGIKARQEATGRFVPSHIPYRIASDLPKIVKSILEENLFDEFYLWDTTEAGKRVPVAKKMPGGSLEILNKTLWERFLNGGK